MQRIHHVFHQHVQPHLNAKTSTIAVIAMAMICYLAQMRTYLRTYPFGRSELVQANCALSGATYVAYLGLTRGFDAKITMIASAILAFSCAVGCIDNYTKEGTYA